MEFLKLSNLILGSVIIILIIVAIAMGITDAKKVQTRVKITARVISAPAKDVIIYPNPFKPSEGHSVITFSNLTKDVTIRIFNIMGEQVYKISNVKGNFEWYVKNISGEKIASGIYLCIIENRSERKIERIAIIR